MLLAPLTPNVAMLIPPTCLNHWLASHLTLLLTVGEHLLLQHHHHFPLPTLQLLL